MCCTSVISHKLQLQVLLGEASFHPSDKQNIKDSNFWNEAWLIQTSLSKRLRSDGFISKQQNLNQKWPNNQIVCQIKKLFY